MLALAVLELTESAFTSQVQGLKVCATAPGLLTNFLEQKK